MALGVRERPDLEDIQFLWDLGLGAAYDVYADSAAHLEPAVREPVALAAALVDTALTRQRLGAQAAEPAALLVADLCLARASRLLADAAPASLQIAFARVVEDGASLSVTGGGPVDVRPRLVDVLRRA